MERKNETLLHCFRKSVQVADSKGVVEHLEDEKCGKSAEAGEKKGLERCGTGALWRPEGSRWRGTPRLIKHYSMDSQVVKSHIGNGACELLLSDKGMLLPTISELRRIQVPVTSVGFRCCSHSFATILPLRGPARKNCVLER